MSAVTPRRSARTPHNFTPKMSERKKSLFQGEVEARSLTQHRRLAVVDSESDGEECDLGIVGALDCSSDELTDPPRTPERQPWHETRSHSKRLLKESHDLKNFIKSPFTLKKYQTKYSHESLHSPLSTPATPHVHRHLGTPSSTHSCASAHTTSSTSSRARKSLASLIADTESCSSSLKDLNFDTDSGTDSKENTPTKGPRRSTRKQKMSMKLATFKGVLLEQKKNAASSPTKSPMVCLTKMDLSNFVSPSQMLKTPETCEANMSPRVHNRRPIVEIAESPEDTCDSEKSYKRLRNNSIPSDNEPNSKYPKLDTSGSAPKARLSLFNSDRLKEMLSTKSFYGKQNPDLNASLSNKLSNAILATSQPRQKRYLTHSQRSKSRKSGQINMGVKHRIRKPKIHKTKLLNRSGSRSGHEGDSTLRSTASAADSSMMSQNTSQELDNDKTDPFGSEKQTIDALLSQWTEEEVPETELSYTRSEQSYTAPTELPCFNSTVIEETHQIFQPVTAVPVTVTENINPNSEVIVELGAKEPSAAPSPPLDVTMSEGPHAAAHGGAHAGFLPVEGGYLLVAEHVQEDELTDLDAIERELKMLDEQILHMARSNNIDASAAIASTETAVVSEEPKTEVKTEKPAKLFPIFSQPNPGTSSPSTNKPTTSTEATKKPLLKKSSNQYVIDAGQKRFGATQCGECGVIYEIGDPQDEHDHLVHHNATDVLRFNGWKEERVVGTYGAGRVLLVRGGSAGWKRVAALLSRVVHPQLGYSEELPGEPAGYTAYLYVEKKQIVGCLVMEPKSRAFKMIPGDPDCCSVEDYPVKCGVSRIWTHKSHQRRGVAGRLLDCARASLIYGHGLRLEEIAFSAPTAAGKALATRYCATPNFFVYLQ
ncbi:hypothetical protein JYU34_015132 [Plutella xylostella]|uniref:Uncharacterized protein n=1 Tax=Plutella xylostella TaxID=51655 RepID=A0ABQ7Q7V3_PLUXY|nr:hypothetical protein JYU34_015132 [Plutella xylostella]